MMDPLADDDDLKKIACGEVEYTNFTPKFAQAFARALLDARKERDKFKKFYKMAIDEHMSLGEEMTLKRRLKEAEAKIETLKHVLDCLGCERCYPGAS